MDEQPVAADTPQPVKPRIAFWDNARFLLIVLVVIGHAISTVRTDSYLAFGLYAYIYLFHMPALIMLAGLFSRAEPSPKVIRSTLQLVVTWLLWEGIWAVIHVTVEDKYPGDGFLISPAWTLWFLVSLATMRIILPYIAMLKHPLLVSIGLALLSGLLPSVGSDFSLSRTLAFLPFFVVGWMVRKRGWLDGQWFTLPARWAKVAAWAVLSAIALVFIFAQGFEDFWRTDKWLTWRDDFDWLFRNAPLGEWRPNQWVEIALGGVGVTALLLTIAAVMTMALLIITPRRQSFMTVWGSRTLYVYLLHGPIIWVLRETDAIDAVATLGLPGIILIIAFAIALAVVLSMEWVQRLFNFVITPKIDWIFSRSKE